MKYYPKNFNIVKLGLHLCNDKCLKSLLEKKNFKCIFNFYIIICIFSLKL